MFSRDWGEMCGPPDLGTGAKSWGKGMRVEGGGLVGKGSSRKGKAEGLSRDNTD